MSRSNNHQDAKTRAYIKKYNRGDDLSLKKPLNALGAVLLLLQLILSIVFLSHLDKMDVLPVKIFSTVFLILLTAFFGCFLLGLIRKTRIFSRVLSVILVFCLGFGVFYTSKTVDFLNRFNNKTKTLRRNYVVLVKAGEDVDLKNAKFAIVNEGTNVIRDKAIAQYEKKIGKMNSTSYGTAVAAVKALVADEVDAVFVNEAHLVAVREVYDDFDKRFAMSEGTAITTEVEQNTKDYTALKKSFIIYLAGNDEEGKLTQTGRTDANVLIVVNPVIHKILLVSTPRDAYTYQPGITPAGYRDKLTHAGNYGVSYTMDTIENLYGIDIDYYAKINFTSMEDLMDVIGPVTVYSEDEFWSWNYPEEHYVVGDNKLDTSRRALGFLRERYGLVGGDFSRGRNHMVFLKAVFKKIMSPSIIVNYLDLIKVVDKAVLSDIPTSLLTSLAKEQIDKNYSWDIESMAPSGTPQYAYSYQIGGEVSVTLLDEDDVAEVSEKIISFMNKR